MAFRLVVITVFSAAMLFSSGCGLNQPTLGTRISVGVCELYVTPEITSDQTQKVREILTREKLIGDKPASFQVRYLNRRYEMRSVVRAGAEGDPSKNQEWRCLADMLSKECFNSSPVDIHLCDEHFKTLRVISFEPLRPKLPVSIGKRPSVGKGSLVARYQNESDRYLTLALNLSRPTTGESKTTSLSIPPRQTIEHGWAEGWAYMSGDRLAISHADYETMVVIVD